VTLDDVREVFEHSPWVAERAWPSGGFHSVDELLAAMMAVVREASREEQLALVRAHPELAGAEAAAGRMTPASAGEQGRLGFDRMARGELEKMRELNRNYREKFGFPCIVALRLHASRDSVLAQMQRRLKNSAEAELANALDQIGHIVYGRLVKLIDKLEGSP
jgi:chitin deacetylase